MEYWQFNSMAVIYFAAIGMSFMLAYLGWRMRPVRGSAMFTILMLFTSCWILGYTLGIYTDVFQIKMWMLRLEYLGIGGAVYFWVLFMARYTQLDNWVNKWIYLLLAIVPFVAFLSILRGPDENVIRYKYVIEYAKGISYFGEYYAWGFYLWVGYLYTMLAVGVMFIFIRLLLSSGKVKKQLSLILSIWFIIFLPNLLFISGRNIIAPYDPTPLALVVVAIIVLINIYSYRFLEVVPLAHNMVLKNVKSGVIIINSKGHIIEINKVALNVVGDTEKQVLGKFVYDVMPELKEIVLRRQPAEKEIKAEIIFGEGQKTFEVSLNPLTDHSGYIFGQVIMMWDISEQKMAMTELDSYARTVAHDLKAPLSHIIGFAKLINEVELSDRERKAYVQNIIASGNKMRNIVDGLLMLAKLRSEDKVELKELDMEKIIQSVCLRMSEYIDDGRVDLQLPNVWDNALGNPIWIEEVWVNLISNAIKYGGSPPKVRVGSTPNGTHVKFWVQDNGQGLEKADQAVLFDEFSRVHPRKEAITGHGLGLSIVQRIVHKLRGEVGVESSVGEGSTFYFCLPKNH